MRRKLKNAENKCEAGKEKKVKKPEKEQSLYKVEEIIIVIVKFRKLPTLNYSCFNIVSIF